MGKKRVPLRKIFAPKVEKEDSAPHRAGGKRDFGTIQSSGASSNKIRKNENQHAEGEGVKSKIGASGTQEVNKAKDVRNNGRDTNTKGKRSRVKSCSSSSSSSGRDGDVQGEPLMVNSEKLSSAAGKMKGKDLSINNDEDDVDWEEIERKQQMFDEDDESDEDGENDGGSDSGGSNDDDDSSSGSSGAGINLEGNLEHVEESFTFEFNDMKDLYTEGICTLLRRMIANPTDAFNFAKLITSQSM